MIRISLIVCVLLTLDVTAKPWQRTLTEEDLQEAIISLEKEGNMLRVEQVEPPEDMDEIQYIIDPRMKIWKSMTDSGKQPRMPEEDLDELYHPSFINLQDQNMGFHPVADTKEELIQYLKEAVQDEGESHHPDLSEVASDEAEQDMDEEYRRAQEQLDVYLAPLLSKNRRNVEARDEDAAHPPAQNGYQAEGPGMVRLHLQPEEDLDDLYHKDPPGFQQNHLFVKAAAPVEYPSQRKHTVPEEDLDHLYHQ